MILRMTFSLVSLIVDHILASCEKASKMEKWYQSRFSGVDPFKTIAPRETSKSPHVIHWVTTTCLDPCLQVTNFDITYRCFFGSIVVAREVGAMHPYVVLFRKQSKLRHFAKQNRSRKARLPKRKGIRPL